MSSPARSCVADREQGRVVLRLLEILRRDAPQLLRAHARRKAAGELLAVDQPVGLRVGADQRGRQKLVHGSLPEGAIFAADARGRNPAHPASSLRRVGRPRNATNPACAYQHRAALLSVTPTTRIREDVMLNRRALLAVPLALGMGGAALAQSEVKVGADRADVGTLGAPGRPDAEGREPRDRAHQRARRHQGAERRQAEAHDLRRRRQRREGEERRAAHGGAGARPRRRHRRLAVELHARRHRGDRARRAAGAHPLLLRPDHRARLQVRVPDLARRRRAGGQRDAGDPQARRERRPARRPRPSASSRTTPRPR